MAERTDSRCWRSCCFGILRLLKAIVRRRSELIAVVGEVVAVGILRLLEAIVRRRSDSRSELIAVVGESVAVGILRLLGETN